MPQLRVCPSAQAFDKLRLGRLTRNDVELVAAHLEQCDRCVETVRELQAGAKLLEILQAPAPKGTAFAGQRLQGLVQRLQENPVTQVNNTPKPDEATLAPAMSDAEDEMLPFLGPARGPGELGWLGSYRVLKLLGSGGMGVVYHAEDPQLKRSVALKVMRPALAVTASARQRFVREAQAAAGITHDHIVHIYQVGEDRSVPFLAMQFLEGESLDARLKRERTVSIAEALRIAREIADGLSAAHGRGMIHRDIKPGNIWLESSATRSAGRVKILDFGLARAAKDEAHLTQSGAIIGTPAYMAPEQARCDELDGRCDLFSLGCILYRMTTGQLPFEGKDTVSTLMSVATEEPVLPHQRNAELPRPLSKLIMSLLEKDKAQRPASALAVIQKIEELERQLAQGILPASGDRAAAAPRPVKPASAGRGAGAVERTEPIDVPKRRLRAEKTRKPRAAAGGGRLWLVLGALVVAGIVVAGVVVALVIVLGHRSTRASGSGTSSGESGAPVSANEIIFNGTDLSDWEGLKYWHVKDGAIVGDSNPEGVKFNTFLCTKNRYRDFEMRFQVRLKHGKGNAGVQFRSEILDREKMTMKGPQADMGSGFWGDLYGENVSGIMKAADRDKVAKVVKKDDYNDFSIRCVGKHITLKLNGVTTVDDDFPLLADEGLIGLQIHSGAPMEVSFRNFEFSNLSKTADGFEVLFNGTDLSGWTVLGGDFGKWAAENGHIVAKGGGGGWLMTEKEYSDFELELEFQIPEKGNSGVALRAPLAGDPAYEGMEIQILDDRGYPNAKPEQLSGAIWGVVAPSKNAMLPLGEWNKYRITAKGRRITIELNGTIVVDANLDEHKTHDKKHPGLKRGMGHVGLQSDVGHIEFRNLRIKPL